MENWKLLSVGAATLLALAGPLGATDEPAEDPSVAAVQDDAVVEIRWVQVPGSRIYREVRLSEGEPVSRLHLSHLPVFVITRDEIDDLAKDNVGDAIKEGLPSTR